MLACQKRGRKWALDGLVARPDGDVNARAKNGFTALMWTISNENMVGATFRFEYFLVRDFILNI